jgi:hypothetical protein
MSLRRAILVLALPFALLASCRHDCRPPSGADAGRDAASDAATDAGTDAAPDAGVVDGSLPPPLSVVNDTILDAVVFVAFGADSRVRSIDWAPFCVPTSAITCSIKLPARSTRILPTLGHYLNATIAFNASVGCGSTKAELNLNNPKWYDVADVSLVDGYSNKIAISVTDPSGTKTLGPPVGKIGNEVIYGLFPLGCDVCTARHSPPCGMLPGKDGCKAGTQYKPSVPCQHQGSVMGGGSTIRVALVP